MGWQIMRAGALTNCANIPGIVTAGLTFRGDVAASGCPAPAWQLSLHLRGAGQIDLQAVGQDALHLFTASAADTADWSAGAYWYVVRATDADDVIELDSGTLEILPDLVSAGPDFDGRSEDEKALAAIDAVLAKRATMDQERYRINNRELWRIPVPDLLKLRATVAARVRHASAKKRGRGGFGRAIHVRFS